MSDTQAYRQFGNSVVVPLMADVAQLVVTKMTELETQKEQVVEKEIEVIEAKPKAPKKADVKKVRPNTRRKVAAV